MTTINKVHRALVGLGMSAAASAACKGVLLGYTDQQIADQIGKSARTAKRHVGEALQVAGVSNRTSLWPRGLALLDGKTLKAYRRENC